jgi:hypothetical protein
VNNKFLYIAIAALIVSILGFVFQMNQTPTDPNAVRNAAQEGLEQAYFNGQRDALTGDIHIKFDTNSAAWVWTSSPWRSKVKTIFQPVVHAEVPNTK